MRILFVVTARGGSKSVPRKNIREIGGIPLIAYKIISAQRTKYNKRIIVSTDDAEIADVAKRFGAEVPFVRPESLATDTASSMDVISHAIDWIESNDNNKYDYVCMLEPSSPFMSYKRMNEALEMLIKNDGDTLLGMKETEVSSAFIHPLDTLNHLSLHYEAIKNMKSVRRQDQVKEYTMNGCIYAAKYEYFKKNKIFHSVKSIPYIMPEEVSIEIDTPLNLAFAEFLVEKGIIDLSEWKDSGI